ncbi:MAG: thioredoxin family protein [Bryobacterales bacterium]|nr:thioredoxin family protein [Bryobacterales bacterium]
MRVPLRLLVLLTTALCLYSALAGAQQSGVVVLEESDFESTPNAPPLSLPLDPHAPPPSPSGGTGEVHHFDPRRDAKADIRYALQVAARERKHVLLDVGGTWCPFCKVLDAFFDNNADILALRSRSFVYVKVNFSKENQNEAALQDYPLIRGYPHFFVLDATGKLVTSQRVALLGTQSGYSPDRFRNFLRSAGPKGK